MIVEIKMNRIQTHKFINWAVCAILAVSVCFMPPTAMAAEYELHEAAKAGDVAKINRLIKAGADVNARWMKKAVHRCTGRHIKGTPMP